MNNILVATTTYNEVDSIGHFLYEVSDSYPDADILVVDDNSPDGTGQLLESSKQSYPRLIHISRPRKLGIGSAHLLIMQYALEQGYDGLITLDADLSHRPSDIPTIVQLLKTHDFVIGSRYASGGSCEYGLLRKGLSHGANLLARVLLGIKSKESTTSFRGFSRALLQKLPLIKIQAADYGFFVETVFWVNQIAERIAEFPIHFSDRRFGQTKISRRAVYRAMFVLVKLFYLRRTGRAKQVLESVEAPDSVTPCQLCDSSYHIEIYPEVSNGDGFSAEAVACTTGHHRSHGRIALCLQCGSVANNPMPSNEQLLTAYADVVDSTYVENLPAREMTFRSSLELARRYVPASGRVVDIGCYCGAFLKIAKEMSYDVVGVEPSVWAAEQAREFSGCTVYNGTIRELPSEEGQFDIATAFDVLEHLVHPVTELEEINRRVKVGGYFVFSTLDYKNWFSQLLGERWPWMMDMHLHYFDVPVILDLVQKTGFRVVEIRPYRHFIPLRYLFSKLDSISGMSMFAKFANLLPNTLQEKKVTVCFGDIKMYTCVKIAEA